MNVKNLFFNGNVYLLGGYASGDALDTVLVFDPAAHTTGLELESD